MKSALDYVTAAAAATMRAAIAEAGGNEVFFAGVLDDELRVAEVTVLARGHATAVPAVIRHFHHLGDAVGGRMAIHNHPSGELQPSEADLQISALLSEAGVGALIVDNVVERVWPVVEPMRARRRATLSEDGVAAMFAPTGALARTLDGYEERKSQSQLAREVTRTFNRGGILLAEAGTGTGKSLGYLAPAIAWSLLNGEQVLVSTNTLNLQDQLERKDLPLMAAAFGAGSEHWPGTGFAAVVMKGRHNYVGRRKAERLRAAGAALLEGEEEERAAPALLAWIDRTHLGDRRELTVPVPESLWRKVASEADNCLRGRCPTHSSCFYYQARRRAQSASVIVVNHALLFADLALRSRIGDFERGLVLPAATNVILDEAHHVEDVAARHFGAEVSRAGILHVLGRLVSGRSERRGALPYLVTRLGELLGRLDPRDAAALSARIRKEAMPAVKMVREELRLSFAALDEGVRDLAAAAAAADPSRGRSNGVVRIDRQLMANPAYAAFYETSLHLRSLLGRLHGTLAPIVRAMEHAAGDDPVVLGEVVELGSLVSRLEGMLQAAASIVRDPNEPADDGQARWIERQPSRFGPGLSLVSQPIDVSAQLGHALHAAHRAVVYTSATLSVAGDFSHLAGRLGLDADEWRGRRRDVALPSAFDYASNCMLAVVTDAERPDAPEAIELQAPILMRALEASQGHAFCLFTSYGALTRMHDRLQTAMLAAGMTPLVQGAGRSRTQILDDFRRLPRPVLFGTDSFWEGVDVRGDALRLVCIQRLPFRPPYDPLQAARSESLRARGVDAFGEYSLPQAILRLSQGFGRLIRTSTDRGVVLVLDGRMGTKPYGRRFLQAVPPAIALVGRAQAVMPEVEEFLARIGREAATGRRSD